MWFYFMTQKPNSSPLSGKAHPLMSKESEASQAEHQEHVGDFSVSFVFLLSECITHQ